MADLPIKERYTAKELGQSLGISTKTAIRWIRDAGMPTMPRVPVARSRVSVSYNAFTRLAKRSKYFPEF